MGGNQVSMALVGDLYIRVEQPENLFELTGSHLNGADITFGNLEGAFSERGILRDGSSGHRSSPRMIAALTAGGFDAVGFANNHSMDYGAQALLDTADVLDRMKIAHAGGGRNISEAHLPAIVESKGITVAFLSYASVFWPTYAADEGRGGIAVVKVATSYQPVKKFLEQPGTPPLIVTTPDAADIKALREDIKSAHKKADIVVISWHWGVSGGLRILLPYQVELGHAAIDAGADLIIGHHPHVLQGIEVYKGKVICYSLGNLVWPDYIKPTFDAETFIVKCQVDGRRISQVSFVPVIAKEDLRPEVLDLKKGQGVVEKIRRLSADFGTKLTASGDEVVVWRRLR